MEIKQVYVKSGDVFVSREPCMFTTLLGSCISVCLYDLTNCWGGINHIVHAGKSIINPQDTLYSEAAIHSLIVKLQQLGSDPRELMAKVIGGGNVMQCITFQIGNCNVNAVFNELMKWNIPILASDVGGKNYRKLHFYSHTGEMQLIR